MHGLLEWPLRQRRGSDKLFELPSRNLFGGRGQRMHQLLCEHLQCIHSFVLHSLRSRHDSVDDWADRLLELSVRHVLGFGRERVFELCRGDFEPNLRSDKLRIMLRRLLLCGSGRAMLDMRSRDLCSDDWALVLFELHIREVFCGICECMLDLCVRNVRCKQPALHMHELRGRDLPGEHGRFSLYFLSCGPVPTNHWDNHVRHVCCGDLLRGRRHFLFQLSLRTIPTLDGLKRLLDLPCR